MQRSPKEIMDWNLKQVHSKVEHLKQRLNEVIQKSQYGHFGDLVAANMIVSTMFFNLEQLRNDMDRFLDLFSYDGSGQGARAQENSWMLDTHEKSKSYTDLTSEKLLLQHSLGIKGSQFNDNLVFNRVIKQIKRLEEVVLSGNIIERIDKLENKQNSRNILPGLETVEKKLQDANRVETLEKRSLVEIHSRLDQVDSIVRQTVEGVFGGTSSLGSQSPCIISRLSTMENQVNEGKAKLEVMSKEMNQLANEARNATSEPQQEEELDEEESPEVDEWDLESVPSVISLAPSEAGSSTIQYNVRFSAVLEHDGPWENGIVLRAVRKVKYNDGDAFDSDRCWFVPPEDGHYRFILKIKRRETGSTEVEAWECGTTGGWVRCLFSVEVNDAKKFQFFTKVVFLNAGKPVRLRVFGGTPFMYCVFEAKRLAK